MKTLLIVDDEVEICATLKTFFEDIPNLTILIAHSGNEGLEYVKNNEIDLILSDIRMPNGDGISLLKGTDLSSTIFYFMSGFSDLSEQEAIKLGAKAIITKPFDVVEIVDQLSKHLS